MPENVLERKLKGWVPGFSPIVFKAFCVCMIASAFVVPLIFVALPFLEIFNDMAVQPKGKTQGLYGRLANEPAVVERAPPEGAIPTGYFPYHLEGKDEKTARKAEATLTNPLLRTEENMFLGKKQFEIYCWTCHGKGGEGDGPIVGPDLFPAPPSLHTDTARKFKDGRIFHIISRGQNTMPSYADKLTPEERWAVTHYLRALQYAHEHGSTEENENTEDTKK